MTRIVGATPMASPSKTRMKLDRSMSPEFLLFEMCDHVTLKPTYVYSYKLQNLAKTSFFAPPPLKITSYLMFP